MIDVPFYIVDSFTHTPYAGNPAGVILPEKPLTKAHMLAIADELHLESAFATPLSDGTADYQVAYYTGAARVPLCGHDTIALATVLAQTGRLPPSGMIRFATDVGVLSVSVAADGLVTMDQALPEYGSVVDSEAAADALGLSPFEIAETGLPVHRVTTGTPFLIVPVVHRAALSALAPDMAVLIAYGDSLEDFIAGFYVWSPETESADSKIHARCFCPALGLPEDPVTGTASGAVGAYLARHKVITPGRDGAANFQTEQGYAMGRPGNVSVRLEFTGTDVSRVQVQGYSAMVGSGHLHL